MLTRRILTPIWKSARAVVSPITLFHVDHEVRVVPGSGALPEGKPGGSTGNITAWPAPRAHQAG